jgi:hypothetical protein
VTRALAAIALLLLLTAGARAQFVEPSLPQSGTVGGSYYNFAGGTGCDLKVSVWGYVRNPGRYTVPCETSLLELLSYCGGPDDRGAYVWLDQVKVVRKGGPGKENQIHEVFTVDVGRFLKLSKEAQTTTELNLFPGDLVIIDGEPKAQINVLLATAQIITAIAQILTSAMTIYFFAKTF